MKLDHPCGLQMALVVSRTLLSHDMYGIKAVFKQRCGRPVTVWFFSKVDRRKSRSLLPPELGRRAEGTNNWEPIYFLCSSPFICCRKRNSKILLHQRKLHQFLIIHLIIIFQKGKLSFMTFLHIWRQHCASTGQDVGFIRCHRQFQLTLMGWFERQEPFKACECQTPKRHTMPGLGIISSFVYSLSSFAKTKTIRYHIPKVSDRRKTAPTLEVLTV